MGYRYITQDIVDAGGINVTCAEMYAEARAYNIEAVRNYSRKRRNYWLIAIWAVGQFVLSLAIAVLIISAVQSEQTERGTTTPTWRILLRLGGFLAYMGAEIYFVIVRRNTRPLAMTACAVPILIASWKFAGIPLLNLLVGRLHEKTENSLRKELGYPVFSRLAITTSYSDADTMSEITFDSIREKARREHPGDDML